MVGCSQILWIVFTSFGEIILQIFENTCLSAAIQSIQNYGFNELIFTIFPAWTSCHLLHFLGQSSNLSVCVWLIYCSFQSQHHNVPPQWLYFWIINNHYCAYIFLGRVKITTYTHSTNMVGDNSAPQVQKLWILEPEATQWHYNYFGFCIFPLFCIQWQSYIF